MIISIGAVVTAFGMLFFMQGNSIVGSYHVVYVFKSTMDSKRQMDLVKWDNNFGSWNRN